MTGPFDSCDLDARDDGDASAEQSTFPPRLHCRKRTRIWLVLMVGVQLVLYGVITLLSDQFQYDSPAESRPLLAMLTVMGVAFVAYLYSIPLVLRLADNWRCIAALFGVAVLMRVIVIPSHPIQEVDLYRYIWDGAVTNQGISPYRFRPLEVRQLVDGSLDPAGTTDDDLSRLANMSRQRAGISETLRRVHYAELPTVYPPVSQAVFAATDWLTPAGADVIGRVRWMKAVIVLLDVGVMALVFWLLVLLRMNPGWCVAYGWSPLVIKEFAGSGHLDSIAVFFCIAAIVCLAAAQRYRAGSPKFLLFSAVLIGLGIGSKLFPLVLIPLAACLILRVWSWRWSIAWTATTTVVAALSLAPMMIGRPAEGSVAAEESDVDSLQGLRTFLTHWQINDLLFMVVEENIRPEGSVAGHPAHWFVILPESWRSYITDSGSRLINSDSERTPFLLARVLTTLGLAVITLFLCRLVWRDPGRFYEAAFLTIAWFWFLSPTQNPWYWTWALPLVPFARNRLWLLVSGLALIYYSRFWFEYHAAETATWGLAYQGVAIFDFIVVWIEFAPFLLLLLASGFAACSKHQPQGASDSNCAVFLSPLPRNSDRPGLPKRDARDPSSGGEG